MPGIDDSIDGKREAVEVLQLEAPDSRFSWGITLGSLSVFISILGAATTFPFLQSQRDTLKCDALCYGSMQSTRSGLSLIGSVLIGRLSDKVGRSKVLWLGVLASTCSYLILLYGSSITAMWLSLIPSSLNHNYNVLKALFADYNAARPESERASAMGRLGMAVGISFMLGPAIGASLLSSYDQATLVALILSLVSGILLCFLPPPPVIAWTPKKKNNTKRSVGTRKEDWISRLRGALTDMFSGVFSVVFVPAAQTPGARLLLFMRALMALAFNVFMTIWTVSLKERFNFGPKDHAYFMGWVGLCYAVSQGFAAKFFMRYTGEDPTQLILICLAVLSAGRVVAMLTSSLVVVYLIMAMVIMALGIVNTAMASACARLADADEVGGLFGIMEAVESLAGFVGPALGGILFSIGEHAPLVSVVLIYVLVFIAVALYFRSAIVDFRKSTKDLSKGAGKASKVAPVVGAAVKSKRKAD